jgi:GT2 family glycosyltransferase
MRANRVNAVRTYTAPPPWLLDLAGENGLRVMVGLAWESHVDFLADRKRARSIEAMVRQGVRSCGGHPAVLCYALGNEIPSSIVRWLGPRRVEGFIQRLFAAAKSEDPAGLVTYVNYPSTEYLDLPFLDLAAFNVYLESQEPFEAYLSRLQNVAGDRPLVLAELGLDSRRHGQRAQAQALRLQLRAAFAAGCAGAFVFAWTDEWHRGGHDIEDWDFGLVTRARRPKPALSAAGKAFADTPPALGAHWPRISVVVCTYNGARIIRDCYEGLKHLEYPNLEVIVVDDGSTDGTGRIAAEYGFRVIRTENRGLSSARNTGAAAATGEIIAYIDDDARPDPHWPHYLAAAFMRTRHGCIGGPNVAPAGDGLVAECVDRSPGNPAHVLLSDSEAEHVPGCNLAVRKSALQAVGGFDPQFRIAGDDVDFCWRLRDKGFTIGFCPGAMVWHHRRGSARQFMKQQLNYGRAEAMLERKWPHKYNGAGHVTWSGRVYGPFIAVSRPGSRVYHGTWGQASFQRIYQQSPGLLGAVMMMPEWYLVNALVALLAFVGLFWPPLRVCGVVLAVTAGVPLLGVLQRISRIHFTEPAPSWRTGLARRAILALLYVGQPAARLVGRLTFGLTLWRRAAAGFRFPAARTCSLWSERWAAPEERLRMLEKELRAGRAVFKRGGAFDRWDMEVRGGLLGSARILLAVEEHGAGRQLIRVRVWAKVPWTGALLGLAPALVATGALFDASWAAAALLMVLAGGAAGLMLTHCGAATALALKSVEALRGLVTGHEGQWTAGASLGAGSRS